MEFMQAAIKALAEAIDEINDAKQRREGAPPGND